MISLELSYVLATIERLNPNWLITREYSDYGEQDIYSFCEDQDGLLVCKIAISSVARTKYESSSIGVMRYPGAAYKDIRFDDDPYSAFGYTVAGNDPVHIFQRNYKKKLFGGADHEYLRTYVLNHVLPAQSKRMADEKAKAEAKQRMEQEYRDRFFRSS